MQLVFFGLRFFLAPVLLGLVMSAGAQRLSVEPVDLGTDDGAETQVYNLQELPQWRVFARSEAGFKRSRVLVQKREAGRWLLPEPLPFADPRWRDSDPQLSADGKTLTFISDRAAQGDLPLAHLDLFESRWVDGAWTAPQRLPETLQSAGYELGPERLGSMLYFASARLVGSKKLTVLQANLADAQPQAVALPAPVNGGGDNSDFTLSPDGRHAIWWSSRDGTQGGGDLFLAERVGSDYGPAIRLPEPINGTAFEFTPSVSADGQWLYFASTRGSSKGLSRIFRVSWPQLLQSLGREAQAHSEAELDRAISALWRAFNNAPGQAADAAAMARLLHPQAQVFGQALKDGQVDVRSWDRPAFLALLDKPHARAQIECETRREKKRYAAHAQVYSVVQTRQDAQQTAPDYVGVNSMHWQLGPRGWQLLSLHYALALPGAPLPAADMQQQTCLA